MAPRRRAVAWSLVAVVVALGGTAAWGAALQRGGTDLTLFAAPFFADWGPRPSWGTAVLIVIALMVATGGPAAARVLPWRRLLVVAWSTTVAWSVGLAASTSWAGLTRSIRSRYDYAAALPEVRRVGLGPYVSTYVSHLDGAPTHVKSHPPGMVVLLRGLEVLGLPGSGWAAAALIAVTATVPIGVAVTVRRMGAEAGARAVLPFLVCGPWTLLVATVADGVFAATVVWGIALLAAATSAGDRRTAAVLALVSGALLAGSLYLSYGLVPLVAALDGRRPPVDPAIPPHRAPAGRRDHGRRGVDARRLPLARRIQRDTGLLSPRSGGPPALHLLRRRQPGGVRRHARSGRGRRLGVPTDAVT